jgi:hypothetical protein
LRELFPAGRGKPVIAATALAGTFHPSSGDPSLALQAVKHGIKGSRLENYGAAGTAFYFAGDLIAMARLGLDLG